MKRSDSTMEQPGRPIQDLNLLDIAAPADAREGIRQGLEDARQGRTRPAEDFFRDFEAEHGLSR